MLGPKYCAYIFMKRSPKDIATLLNVEPKSIRMSKYRLKQKLGLGKDDDLEDYISKLA
jgi:DNA-binding CsgD family transcriptional regulator